MQINKTLCDECNQEIEDIECVENQIKFRLCECMDGGDTYEFCGVECLKNFLVHHKFQKRFYHKPKNSRKRTV